MKISTLRRAIVTWTVVAVGASFFLPLAFPQWFPNAKVPPAFLIMMALLNFAAAGWWHWSGTKTSVE